ncbi:polysaccharide pyruvyl transferase family protein [Microbacterium sp. HA-8]|uniref:polysaccharide pyruvyl transferase family protein n=1 Tax=Microbacterium sp. HA-8 TaxID=3234200 RepID=UPI0038F7D50C
MSRERSALTVGPHGGENLGDELILSTVLEVLSDAGWSPSAMSSHPSLTAEVHGVRAVEQINVKHRRFSALRRLDRFDLLVLAGGEQLAEGRFHNPLWGHLANAWLTMRHARKNGIDYCIYSVGAEEIKSTVGRRMLRSLLNGARFVAIRDPRSYEYLRKLAPDAPLFLTADPVYDLERVSHLEARAALLKRENLPDGPLLLFAPADDHRVSTDYVDTIAAALIGVAERIGGTLLVQAMEHQESYDPRLLQKAVFHHGRVHVMPLRQFDKRELIETFAGVDHVTSARMHPLILAATQGTPWLCLNRNRKLETFSAELGRPGLPLDVSADRVQKRVAQSIRQGRAEWQDANDNALAPLVERARYARALLNAI